MIDTSLVLAFLLAAVTGFFSPGPNNLMLMTSSAKFGITRTAWHAGGISIGFPVMIFCVGLGLGEVFTAFPALRTIMRYGAALYFLWMAWMLLGVKVGAAGGSERPMRFHEAALFQWINPKAWAMAVSLVALFVPAGEARLVSVLILALGCLVVSPLSCVTWMVFGQGLVAFLRRTGLEYLLGWILSGLMLAAVVLFLI